jgi:hypothetical protein
VAGDTHDAPIFRTSAAFSISNLKSWGLEPRNVNGICRTFPSQTSLEVTLRAHAEHKPVTNHDSQITSSSPAQQSPLP